MILFIFEGKDDEPRLYKTLKTLFNFELDEEEILYYYCNNIYSLYQTIKTYNHDESNFFETIDIVRILKEECINNHKDFAELNKIKYAYEISEIFLFFDYDVKKIDKKNKLSIEEQNSQILELLNFFNDTQLETERYGIKLFINYPMIESYRYFKNPLPDDNYKNYTFDIFADKTFKQIANEFSDYKNLKYLCYDINKSGELKKNTDTERENKIKENWLHIKNMNIKKANFICTDNYTEPKNKEIISQTNIFHNQILKYINPNKEIAILNAFPLFWFEYIDESKLL